MNKIKELELKITEAQTAYYNGEAIIDDDQYDALLYELSCLDPNNKVLIKIGAEPTNEWKKEKHLFPLGSLSKVNTPSEMAKWMSDSIPNQEVLVMDKLDGLSIGCQYEDGKLTKAILRGGGEEGEDILTNVLKMNGIVKYIPNFTGVLRGEIILTKTNHLKYFADKSNPRNAASGICRRLDGEGCEHLTVMFYQVLGKDFSTEKDQFKFLEDNNCLIPKYKFCKTPTEVNDLWEEYQDTTRDSLDYEIDGLVVACSDIGVQESLGSVNLKPKGKMAFKFANQFIKTTVKEIRWVVGNSGRITPVCWVEPVNLLGSRVEKASVYNIAYINKLGLGVGADVLICKANEIIPRIEKVVKSGTSEQLPTKCPVCNSEAEMVGENLVCTNVSTCTAQVEGRIKNWIKELNILEWGTSLLDKLVESGKVTTVADLYKLTIDDLASIDRMGKKSAKKCYDTLWASKEIPLDLFLGSLSIPMIGVSTIKQIIGSGCDCIDKFMQSNADYFETVPGVGPNKAQSLANGLKQNEQLITQILSNGVKIKENVVGKLTGYSICFTGTMTNKRAILEKMVVDAGGKVKSSVCKGLTYLVINDLNSTTSKTTAAKKLGTKLINEQQFLELVK